jgi:transposase
MAPAAKRCGTGDSLRDNRHCPVRQEREAAIVTRMVLNPAQLPDDIASLKALLIEENRRATEAEARASDLDAEIENLKLTIAKLRHARFGNSSERTSVLLDQLELQLGELVERRAQETAAQEIAAQKAQASGKAPTKKRSVPARRPLPDRLPRERVVLPSAQACPCCGGRLRKLGEDVTETLERVPASWKVVQYVREKMTCRTPRRATARRAT